MFAAFGGLFSPENVESVVRNCLLVLGGFMLGYLLGWVIGIGVNRYLAKGKAPIELQQLIRLICGILVAILVALKVFSGGGKGPGDGGPAGQGTGESNAASQQPAESPTDPKVAPKVKPPEPKNGANDSSAEESVTVRVLGGDNAKGDLVYQFGDDPTSPKLNFKDLKSAILQKQKDAAPRKLRVVLERPGSDNDKVADNNPTWTLLKRWLTDQSIPSLDR